MKILLYLELIGLFFGRGAWAEYHGAREFFLTYIWASFGEFDSFSCI